MRAMLLRARLALVILLSSGCGEEAPAPVSQLAPEFDDPFADEATPAAAPAPPVSPVMPVMEPPVTPEPVVAPRSPVPEVTPEPASAKQAIVKRKPTRESVPVPEDIPAPAPQIPAEPPATPPPAPATTTTTTIKPAVPEHERFAGSWSYAGGQAQRDGLAAGVEATVQSLNVLFRPLARKKLTEGNPLREQVVLAVAGDAITVGFGGDRKVSGRLGGPGVAWTSESGSALTVTFSLVKGRIVMNCVAKDGARRNVFTLDASGDRLTMSVTMSSERLPVPVQYALTYRRK